MKYVKPKIIFSAIISQKDFANLSHWLSQNSLENAGITTYELKS